MENGLNLETELFAQIFATEDMKEGTSAFLEKRKAEFSREIIVKMKTENMLFINTNH